MGLLQSGQPSAPKQGLHHKTRKGYIMKIKLESWTGRASKMSGFTLVELMVVITIIAIIAGIAIPSYQNFVKRAETTEAIDQSTRIVKAIQGFVDSHPNTTPADINALIQPGAGNKGNLNSGTVDDEISSLIPHLKAPSNARFQYEIAIAVQDDRKDVRICVKSYLKGGDPTAFVLYSSAASKKSEWENNAFLNKFVDPTIAAVAGGNCDADGAVGADAG